ncbi:hypothetical protein [Bdellovibrio sp. KM01]|uniref:hypothetical protein n=1 Tax=Bdellovibrio sp. KM01 TaxID=2748865 RepID=UPI0015E90476|nr:hypothetical protein [Bdellovibrio sp. KM01]QLY24798.1 hypothetical protein HW988_15345 [Bdellovibrio sp. KM01]
MKKPNFILATLVTAFCLHAQAGLIANYATLATKDLDQMNELVNEKIQESEQLHDEKYVPLKEALQAVFSRPDGTDDMIDKVVGPLRTKLDELDQWENALTILVDEAVDALKHPKGVKPVIQNTYAVFLENFVAESKPYAKSNGFERKLLEKIRDAKIEMTREAKNERSLRGMKVGDSPSDLAKRVLEQNPVEKPAASKDEKKKKK